MEEEQFRVAINLASKLGKKYKDDRAKFLGISTTLGIVNGDLDSWHELKSSVMIILNQLNKYSMDKEFQELESIVGIL